MRHILVATDFSDTAAAALGQAASLASALGARVTLLHVVYDDKITETLLGLDAMEYLTRMVGEEATAEEGAEYLRNSALDKLRESIASVPDPRPDMEPAVVSGKPAEEIVAYAAAHGVDFIVVGTLGRGAIGKAFLGSVADKVIRLAECPVLVVRHG